MKRATPAPPIDPTTLPVDFTPLHEARYMVSIGTAPLGSLVPFRGQWIFSSPYPLALNVTAAQLRAIANKLDELREFSPSQWLDETIVAAARAGTTARMLDELTAVQP